MTQVTFVASVQDHQTDRLREIAERLRAHRADVTVTLVAGEAAKAMLAQHKLNFGPAIVIDGRVEYVGIPRWRFLEERLAQVVGRLPNPRTAAPPEKAAPVAKPTAAAPARPPPTPPKPATEPRASNEGGPS